MILRLTIAWQKSLPSICHNFTRFRRTMYGGAEVLPNGPTYPRQRQILKAIINLTCLASWGFMIYAFRTYKNGRWSSPKSMAYMGFAFTITGLLVNVCWS